MHTNTIGPAGRLLFAGLGLLVAAVLPGCDPMGPGMGGNLNDNGDPPPPQQLDTDGDGVRDDIDQCDNTPVDAVADVNGCAESQLDGDGDGINNDIDECTDTPFGAAVDANGCAASERDTDGDGINDDEDACEDTPTTVMIDDAGCPVSVGGPDTDRDGVPDDIDQCDNTPLAAAADVNGCAQSQLDSDGDGITNDIDECADTPDGQTADVTGCSASQLDADGDGVSNDSDLCDDTPAGQIVDRTGCPAAPDGGGNGGGGDPPPPGVVCGNGLVEMGEQCDPPDGDTCDANCQTTTGGALTNDSCEAPIAVVEETRSFSTMGATTDGPEIPAACALLDDTQVGSDIWYCYTASCTEMVVVSLCCAAYDTKLAVYDGCGCPSGDSIACSDDNCGTGTSSRTVFSAVAGNSYMIRVGGFDGAQGNGSLTIFCASDPDHGTVACGDTDAGDCFSANATPGCNNTEACLSTCTVDPCCCDTEWDGLCAEKADGIANGFSECAAGSGSCAAANGTAGCEDTACCQAVCESDPFCCLQDWDEFCTDSIGAECDIFPACQTSTETCSAVHAGPGCGDETCCNQVCQTDDACCQQNGPGWDDVCVALADNCGGFAACQSSTESCFVTHGTAGCNAEACCTMVCNTDQSCCDAADAGWTDACVTLAAQCR